MGSSLFSVSEMKLSERLQVAERPDDGSRGLQPTVPGSREVRRGATPEGCMTSQRSTRDRSAAFTPLHRAKALGITTVQASLQAGRVTRRKRRAPIRHGARDSSRRNVRTADTRPLIPSPVHQPTPLRTKVRAPVDHSARAKSFPLQRVNASTLQRFNALTI